MRARARIKFLLLNYGIFLISCRISLKNGRSDEYTPSVPKALKDTNLIAGAFNLVYLGDFKRKGYIPN